MNDLENFARGFGSAMRRVFDDAQAKMLAALSPEDWERHHALTCVMRERVPGMVAALASKSLIHVPQSGHTYNYQWIAEQQLATRLRQRLVAEDLTPERIDAAVADVLHETEIAMRRVIEDFAPFARAQLAIVASGINITPPEPPPAPHGPR